MLRAASRVPNRRATVLPRLTKVERAGSEAATSSGRVSARSLSTPASTAPPKAPSGGAPPPPPTKPTSAGAPPPPPAGPSTAKGGFPVGAAIKGTVAAGLFGYSAGVVYAQQDTAFRSNFEKYAPGAKELCDFFIGPAPRPKPPAPKAPPKEDVSPSTPIPLISPTPVETETPPVEPTPTEPTPAIETPPSDAPADNVQAVGASDSTPVAPVQVEVQAEEGKMRVDYSPPTPHVDEEDVDDDEEESHTPPAQQSEHTPAPVQTPEPEIQQEKSEPVAAEEQIPVVAAVEEGVMETVAMATAMAVASEAAAAVFAAEDLKEMKEQAHKIEEVKEQLEEVVKHVEETIEREIVSHVEDTVAHKLEGETEVVQEAPHVEGEGVGVRNDAKTEEEMAPQPTTDTHTHEEQAHTEAEPAPVGPPHEIEGAADVGVETPSTLSEMVIETPHVPSEAAIEVPPVSPPEGEVQAQAEHTEQEAAPADTQAETHEHAERDSATPPATAESLEETVEAPTTEMATDVPDTRRWEAEVGQLKDEISRLYSQLQYQEERVAQAVKNTSSQLEKQFAERLVSELQAVRSEADRVVAEEKRVASERMDEERALLRAQHNEELLASQRRLERLHEEYYRHRLAEEVQKHFDAGRRAVAIKVGRERAERAKVLQELYLRLKDIERLLQAHAKVHSEDRRTHRLWATRALLEASVQSGQPLAVSRSQLAKRDDDPLVQLAVENLPQAVFDRGLVSHGELQQRLSTVRREARRAALLPADGGRFGAYIVASVVDKFTFRRFPAEVLGLGEGPTTHEQADQIVALAEQHMAKGDLEEATREINKLRGWPRAVAQSWLDDARARLETEQALALLGAHCAASSLQRA